MSPHNEKFQERRAPLVQKPDRDRVDVRDAQALGPGTAEVVVERITSAGADE